MSNIVRRRGLGASIVSYESATVAYNSDGMYVNPQTGQVYGVTPPTGGWVVPQDPTYKPGVVQTVGASNYGTSVLAPTPAVAPAATPTTVTSNVSVSSTAPPPPSVVTSTTAAASSNAPVASSTVVNSGSLSNLFGSLSNPVFDIGTFAVTPLLLIAAAIGAFMLMGGESHGRGR